MKRKLFSAALILSSLLLAVALFSCSDDKDGYVSCTEVETAWGQCYESTMSEVSTSCGEIANEDDRYECEDAIVYGCLQPKVCGGNSFMECMTHYETACYNDEE